MARHALLIGVSEFADNRLARLNAPTNDVLALRSILQDAARGAFDSVALSLNDDFVAMRDHLSRFFHDRAPDDLLLLYYSGHGILGRGNRLFLATTGSNLDSPRDRSMSAKEIREFIEECRAERQIIILDCCHSGAFAEHAKSAVPPPAVTDATFSGADAGVYVLTAADALQFAWDGADLRSGDGSAPGFSQFTSWLVEGLEKGAAAPDDEQITIDALYRYLFRRARSAGSAATPQRFVQGGVGDLVVAHNPLARAGQVDPTTAAALDSEDWRVRLGAVTELAQQMREAPGIERPVRLLLQRRQTQERDFAVRTAITAALQERQEPPAPETAPDQQSPPRQPAPPPAEKPAGSGSTAAVPASAASIPRQFARPFTKVLVACGILLAIAVMASAFYGSMSRPSGPNPTAASGPGAVADWSSQRGNAYTYEPAGNAKNPATTTKSPTQITDSTALLGGSTVDLLPGKLANSLDTKQNFANAGNSYGNAAQDPRAKIGNDTQAMISKIEQETKAAASPGDNSGIYVGTYTASLAPGTNRITTQFRQSGSTIAATYQTSTGVSGVGSGTISGNVGNMNWQNTSPNCPGAFHGTYIFDGDKVSFTANGQDCLGVEAIKGEARRTN